MVYDTEANLGAGQGLPELNSTFSWAILFWSVGSLLVISKPPTKSFSAKPFYFDVLVLVILTLGPSFILLSISYVFFPEFIYFISLVTKFCFIVPFG